MGGKNNVHTHRLDVAEKNVVLSSSPIVESSFRSRVAESKNPVQVEWSLQRKKGKFQSRKLNARSKSSAFEFDANNCWIDCNCRTADNNWKTKKFH